MVWRAFARIVTLWGLCGAHLQVVVSTTLKSGVHQMGEHVPNPHKYYRVSSYRRGSLAHKKPLESSALGKFAIAKHEVVVQMLCSLDYGNKTKVKAGGVSTK